MIIVHVYLVIECKLNVFLYYYEIVYIIRMYCNMCIKVKCYKHVFNDNVCVLHLVMHKSIIDVTSIEKKI